MDDIGSILQKPKNWKHTWGRCHKMKEYEAGKNEAGIVPERSGGKETANFKRAAAAFSAPVRQHEKAIKRTIPPQIIVRQE